MVTFDLFWSSDSPKMLIMNQVSGMADAGTALDYIHWNPGVFVVDSTASYDNIRNVIDPAVSQFNTTAAHAEKFGFPTRPAPVASWSAGHLLPGDRATASFAIRKTQWHLEAMQVREQDLMGIHLNHI